MPRVLWTLRSQLEPTQMACVHYTWLPPKKKKKKKEELSLLPSLSIMLPTYCQDVNRFHCSVRTLRALRALTRLQKKTSNMYIYRTFCELGNAGLLRFACISKRKKKKKSNGIRTTVPVQEVNAAAATAATHDDDEHVPSPLFSYFFFFFFFLRSFTAWWALLAGPGPRQPRLNVYKWGKTLLPAYVRRAIILPKEEISK